VRRGHHRAARHACAPNVDEAVALNGYNTINNKNRQNTNRPESALPPRSGAFRLRLARKTKETNTHLVRKVGQVELKEGIELRHDFRVHAFAEQTTDARREHLAAPIVANTCRFTALQAKNIPRIACENTNTNGYSARARASL
jgi:hypothetical protein